MSAIEITDGTTITLSVGMLTTLFGVATAWITLREKVAQQQEKIGELKGKVQEMEKRVADHHDFINRRREREKHQTQEMVLPRRPGPRRALPLPTPSEHDED